MAPHVPREEHCRVLSNRCGVLTELKIQCGEIPVLRGPEAHAVSGKEKKEKSTAVLDCCEWEAEEQQAWRKVCFEGTSLSHLTSCTREDLGNHCNVYSILLTVSLYTIMQTVIIEFTVLGV